MAVTGVCPLGESSGPRVTEQMLHSHWPLIGTTWYRWRAVPLKELNEPLDELNFGRTHFIAPRSLEALK